MVPIIRDKLFFYTNYEYQNQVQAYALQQDLPSLAGLASGSSEPVPCHLPHDALRLQSVAKNTLFARYSHDGNLGFGPYGGAQPLQSSWSSNNNWSDQYASVSPRCSRLISSTTCVGSITGGEAWWKSPREAQCPAPCVGQGLTSLVAGGSAGARHGRLRHILRRRKRQFAATPAGALL